MILISVAQTTANKMCLFYMQMLHQEKYILGDQVKRIFPAGGSVILLDSPALSNPEATD
jgi:hypothetical protein